LLPLLPNLWALNSGPLRDEILAMLSLTQPHITAALSQRPSGQFRSNAEQLLDSLQEEYLKRRERDQLHLDDLLLVFNTSPSIRRPFTNPLFRLSNGHMESEPKWALLQIIALLSSVLDRNREHIPRGSPDGPSSNKRVRVSDCFQECLRLARSGSLSMQLGALQTLSFLVLMVPMDANLLPLIGDTLTMLMSNSNGSIASWAMLAMAGCAFQKSASSSSLTEFWLQVWQFAGRAIPSPSTSRAASHLSHALLAFKLVSYDSVSESLDNILAQPELAGPALLTDSTTAFLLTFVKLQSSESPSSSRETSEKLLRWAFRKWSPSKRPLFRPKLC
jgi:serine-protein kinase ATM